MTSLTEEFVRIIREPNQTHSSRTLYILSCLSQQVTSRDHDLIERIRPIIPHLIQMAANVSSEIVGFCLRLLNCLNRAGYPMSATQQSDLLCFLASRSDLCPDDDFCRELALIVKYSASRRRIDQSICKFVSNNKLSSQNMTALLDVTWSNDSMNLQKVSILIKAALKPQASRQLVSQAIRATGYLIMRPNQNYARLAETFNFLVDSYLWDIENDTRLYYQALFIVKHLDQAVISNQSNDSSNLSKSHQIKSIDWSTKLKISQYNQMTLEARHLLNRQSLNSNLEMLYKLSLYSIKHKRLKSFSVMRDLVSSTVSANWLTSNWENYFLWLPIALNADPSLISQIESKIGVVFRKQQIPIEVKMHVGAELLKRKLVSCLRPLISTVHNELMGGNSHQVLEEIRYYLPDIIDYQDKVSFLADNFEAELTDLFEQLLYQLRYIQTGVAAGILLRLSQFISQQWNYTFNFALNALQLAESDSQHLLDCLDVVNSIFSKQRAIPQAVKKRMRRIFSTQWSLYSTRHLVVVEQLLNLCTQSSTEVSSYRNLIAQIIQNGELVTDFASEIGFKYSEGTLSRSEVVKLCTQLVKHQQTSQRVHGLFLKQVMALFGWVWDWGVALSQPAEELLKTILSFPPTQLLISTEDIFGLLTAAGKIKLQPHMSPWLQDMLASNFLVQSALYECVEHFKHYQPRELMDLQLSSFVRRALYLMVAMKDQANYLALLSFVEELQIAYADILESEVEILKELLMFDCSVETYRPELVEFALQSDGVVAKVPQQIKESLLWKYASEQQISLKLLSQSTPVDLVKVVLKLSSPDSRLKKYCSELLQRLKSQPMSDVSDSNQLKSQITSIKTKETIIDASNVATMLDQKESFHTILQFVLGGQNLEIIANSLQIDKHSAIIQAVQDAISQLEVVAEVPTGFSSNRFLTASPSQITQFIKSFQIKDFKPKQSNSLKVISFLMRVAADRSDSQLLSQLAQLTVSETDNLSVAIPIHEVNVQNLTVPQTIQVLTKVLRFADAYILLKIDLRTRIVPLLQHLSSSRLRSFIRVLCQFLRLKDQYSSMFPFDLLQSTSLNIDETEGWLYLGVYMHRNGLRISMDVADRIEKNMNVIKTDTLKNAATYVLSLLPDPKNDTEEHIPLSEKIQEQTESNKTTQQVEEDPQGTHQPIEHQRNDQLDQAEPSYEKTSDSVELHGDLNLDNRVSTEKDNERNGILNISQAQSIVSLKASCNFIRNFNTKDFVTEQLSELMRAVQDITETVAIHPYYCRKAVQAEVIPSLMNLCRHHTLSKYVLGLTLAFLRTISLKKQNKLTVLDNRTYSLLMGVLSAVTRESDKSSWAECVFAIINANRFPTDISIRLKLAQHTITVLNKGIVIISCLDFLSKLPVDLPLFQLYQSHGMLRKLAEKVKHGLTEQLPHWVRFATSCCINPHIQLLFFKMKLQEAIAARIAEMDIKILLRFYAAFCLYNPAQCLWLLESKLVVIFLSQCEDNEELFLLLHHFCVENEMSVAYCLHIGVTQRCILALKNTLRSKHLLRLIKRLVTNSTFRHALLLEKGLLALMMTQPEPQLLRDAYSTLFSLIKLLENPSDFEPLISQGIFIFSQLFEAKKSVQKILPTVLDLLLYLLETKQESLFNTPEFRAQLMYIVDHSLSSRCKKGTLELIVQLAQINKTNYISARSLKILTFLLSHPTESEPLSSGLTLMQRLITAALPARRKDLCNLLQQNRLPGLLCTIMGSQAQHAPVIIQILLDLINEGVIWNELAENILFRDFNYDQLVKTASTGLHFLYRLLSAPHDPTKIKKKCLMRLLMAFAAKLTEKDVKLFMKLLEVSKANQFLSGSQVTDIIKCLDRSSYEKQTAKTIERIMQENELNIRNRQSQIQEILQKGAKVTMYKSDGSSSNLQFFMSADCAELCCADTPKKVEDVKKKWRFPISLIEKYEDYGTNSGSFSSSVFMKSQGIFSSAPLRQLCLSLLGANNLEFHIGFDSADAKQHWVSMLADVLSCRR